MPPSGTVTFLFTDIEGSTRRWDAQPEAMRVALARHDALLRAEIEGHGGHVFKSMGDAFCAAFSAASAALAAALNAHQALAAEDWGAVGSIRIRIALHTGSAEERDNDYFGPPLNRVARLLAAGHGGQTLLSQATYELVRDQLPTDVDLRDLGEHRLKDLSRPERVFQLTRSELPAEFPSLKTLDARPNNLPAQPNPLIGREREVREICERLLDPTTRILTLSGPGGTGKTRLGLQAAAELLDSFADGVFFVALAPISDPLLVPSAIAQPLGVHEADGRSIEASLNEFLRDKTLLLVLDNFEQIVSAASLVSSLVRGAHNLKVLVTSREVLHLSGEHEYPVPPLALPDRKRLPSIDALTQYEAVRLFIQRAQAALPAFSVTNDNAPAVAEICLRLDGLPLAIELAAARVKLLPPEALLSRLDSRLKVLTGGARDLPARQQTLRGAIQWSYDLLNPVEQALFRRLAVFNGGWTLEAAESVCDADGDLGLDVLDALSSLVDKSLVRQVEAGGEPRFEMLETIREYALERLIESGEREAAGHRHASYFVVIADPPESMRSGAGQAGPGRAAWLARLDREHGNLQAALAWSETRQDGAELLVHLAGTLRTYAARFGQVHGPTSWLGAAPLSSRARALSDTAHIAFGLGDYARAEALSEECLAVCRELGDDASAAFILHFLGLMQGYRGDFAAARRQLGESRALYRGLGNAWGIGLVAYCLGKLARFQGESEEAYALVEQGLPALRQAGDAVRTVEALCELGGLALDRGDAARAAELAAQGLHLLRDRGLGWYLADTLELLAAVATSRGAGVRAARLFGAAEASRIATGASRQPVHQDIYLRQVAAARAALDNAAFVAAWAEGQALTSDTAIDYALETGPKRTATP